MKSNITSIKSSSTSMLIGVFILTILATVFVSGANIELPLPSQAEVKMSDVAKNTLASLNITKVSVKQEKKANGLLRHCIRNEQRTVDVTNSSGDVIGQRNEEVGAVHFNTCQTFDQNESNLSQEIQLFEKDVLNRVIETANEDNSISSSSSQQKSIV